jgi:hypothetical protein
VQRHGLPNRNRTTSHFVSAKWLRRTNKCSYRLATVLLPTDDRPSVDHELLVRTINRRAWESVAGWLDHCAASQALAEPSSDWLRQVARDVRAESARRHR